MPSNDSHVHVPFKWLLTYVSVRIEAMYSKENLFLHFVHLENGVFVLTIHSGSANLKIKAVAAEFLPVLLMMEGPYLKHSSQL